jgi:hypothetical protein
MDVVLAMAILGFAILGILRPAVILRWAMRAHPEFVGEERALLLMVRLIGAAGLGIGIFLAVIVFRSVE